MSEEKEIKVMEEALDLAILKLTEYRDALVKSKNSIVSATSKMKSHWLGVGGNTFSVQAEALESRLAERIAAISTQIDNLKFERKLRYGM